MLEAVLAGAGDEQIDGVEVSVRPALTASAIEVLEADAYLLGTPVNIGYISGALKHFFDQIYYPCLGATRGRPYGLYVHGNEGLEGGVRSTRVHRLRARVDGRGSTVGGARPTGASGPGGGQRARGGRGGHHHGGIVP